MLGVTAEPQAVQTKAKATGIPVILNDNAGALRRMEPDIILFAPPPSLAAPLTESVLVSLFCRVPRGRQGAADAVRLPAEAGGQILSGAVGHDARS